MNFTWKAAKRTANLKKHGFDFANAVTICHTESEDEIHIISMRKAEPHEIETLSRYL